MPSLVNEIILERQCKKLIKTDVFVLQHGCHESTPLIKFMYGCHRNVECFHVSFDVPVTDHTLARSKLQVKCLNVTIDKSG